MATESLSESDFQPCWENDTWLLQSHVLLKVYGDLQDILPEVVVEHKAVPFLMAACK